MFSEQENHEIGIKRSYIENVRGKRLSYRERIRLILKGASIRINNRHMDAKILKCYPRGPAFIRIVEIHSVSQLTGRYPS